MNCLSDKDFNEVDVLLDEKKIFQRPILNRFLHACKF